MNIKDFFASLLSKLKGFLKKILSAICDEDMDLDIYRLGGIGAYAIAGIIALRTLSLVSTLSEAKLAILAGLVTALSGIGTTLFSQARKGDDARIK